MFDRGSPVQACWEAAYEAAANKVQDVASRSEVQALFSALNLKR